MTSRRPGTVLAAIMTVGVATPAHAFPHHGGGGGGYHGGGFHTGGYRGGYAPQAVNRTPSFSTPRSQPARVTAPSGSYNVTRAGTQYNVTRSVNITNVNVANRAGWGWHNPYWGAHQGWVHGYWNGHYPGGWAPRPYGYAYPGFGGGFGWGLGLGLGVGLGWGLSAWAFGPMLYNWGYSNYYNPYYGGIGVGVGAGGVGAGQPVAYNYSQPLNTQSEPPPQDVTTAASSAFEAARDAFKAGDYASALNQVDGALRQTPNDPTLHEFRALALFALKRYDEAAAALYAVLSVGPGWDWTTLISLYGDPETYTQELRALEAYCGENSRSAPAHFTLAYHYLTQGHIPAALEQLKSVQALQPKDQISGQLIAQLEQSQQQSAATGTAGGQGQGLAPAAAPPTAVADNTAANTAPAGTPSDTSSPGKDRKLEGTWAAQAAPDTAITLSFVDDAHFVWKVARQGNDQQFNGTFSYQRGILTLVQEPNKFNVMVGNVSWKDDSHFNFKVPGAGPGDPGLSFSRSP